jgi:tetratricopeptide (TPR) repeat protein
LLDDAYEESWRLPHAAWKARYEPELPGVWAVLAWASVHDLLTAVAVFGAAAPLWLPRATQARPHALALAERLADDAAAATIPPAELARFWWACARCHSVIHPGLARDAAERAAGLYRALGDDRGEYLALVEHAFNYRVDGPEARATLAAARKLESPGWPAAVLERGLTTEAVLHLTSGQHDEARRCYQAALALCERGGFDAGVIRARLNLADQARAAGELDLAVQLGEALLAEPGDAGDLTCLASIMGNLIGALVAQGRFERAREVALQAPLRLGRLTLGDQLWVALDGLALLHLHEGRTELAAQLLGVADREFESHGQMQRQPNEAQDRATLVARLAAQLSAADVARLAQEGRRMSLPDAMRAAFEL